MNEKKRTQSKISNETYYTWASRARRNNTNWQH